MRDLMTELKELRLHGMASAWEELVSQGTASTASSKWLLEHLLQQEHADRAVRSVNHQMNMAKLPMHRDLAGFDFSASSADARLVSDLSSLAFTETAQNVVFIGGPGTGKTHLASALAVSIAVKQFTPVSMEVLLMRKPSLDLSRPCVGVSITRSILCSKIRSRSVGASCPILLT